MSSHRSGRDGRQEAQERPPWRCPDAPQGLRGQGFGQHYPDLTRSMLGKYPAARRSGPQWGLTQRPVAAHLLVAQALCAIRRRSVQGLERAVSGGPLPLSGLSAAKPTLASSKAWTGSRQKGRTALTLCHDRFTDWCGPSSNCCGCTARLSWDERRRCSRGKKTLQSSGCSFFPP